MGAAKFEITRKCKICGEPFLAKTITSWYCSPRCSKVAFKRRKDEEKRNYCSPLKLKITQNSYPHCPQTGVADDFLKK